MVFKAIAFDYDGVLVDSDPFHKKALAFAAQKVEVPFGEKDYKEIFVGRKMIESVPHYLSLHKKISETKRFIGLKESFDQYYPDQMVVFKGVLDLIKKARDKYRLCIVSGSRKIRTDIFLEKYQLKSMFEFVLTAEDCQKGKPDPEIYRLALAKFSLPPEKVLAIEDSPPGVASAKAAGIKCLAVTQTHSEKELQEADWRVESLIDLDISSL